MPWGESEADRRQTGSTCQKSDSDGAPSVLTGPVTDAMRRRPSGAQCRPAGCGTCLPRLASMRGLLQVQTEQRLEKGRVGFLVLIRIPGESIQTEETMLLCPESLPFLQAGSQPLPPAPGGREMQPSAILRVERPVHSRLPRMPKSGILGGLVGRKPAPQSGAHHPPSTC